MSKNIVEELPARKTTPAATPVKASAGGKGSVEEGSEKKIRQAVYDIRYRARREDIDLKAAYAQYMANSSLNQKEKSIVREKLFGKDGGGVKEQVMLNIDEIASDNLANALYKVFVEPDIQEEELELAYLDQLNEEDSKKFKVRVTDNNGKSYVRYANRDKITQLRQNSNIKSVEMTGYGEPYEGSRKKKAKKDYDGDGKVESSSKEHAGVVHNAIQRKKGGKPDGQDTRSEAMDKAWERTFIADGTVTTEPKNKKKVTGEDVDNYKSGAVKVAPVEKSGDDPSVKAARGGIYASFAHQNMLNTLAEKKACDSKKKKKTYKEDANYGYDKEGKSLNPKDKKKEEKKDMRGYYAKINLVKNKIRAMGVKDPCIIADPDDIDKTWDDKCVKDGIKDKDDGPTKGQKLNMYGEERTAADPDMPRRMGRVKSGTRGAPDLERSGTSTNAAGEKIDWKTSTDKNTGKTTVTDKYGTRDATLRKATPRYNPFKDGRTPTSASQTTGP